MDHGKEGTLGEALPNGLLRIHLNKNSGQW